MLSAFRRITWWQTLVLVVCLFGVFVACLGLWLRSSGDLTESDERARALGLPLTVAEVAFATTTDERIADWKRFLAIADQLRPWSEGEAARGWMPLPGTAPPAALAAHHAGLDAGLLAEADAILARLGEAPVDLHRELSPTAHQPDVAALRRHMRLRCERILLAAPEALADEAIRAAALMPLREPASLLRLMVQVNLIEQWTTAVLCRSADLGTAHAAIADRAEALAVLPPAALAAAWRHDLVALRGFVASADPSAVWRGLGRSGGGFSPDAWGFAIALRAGRARTLALMQDIAAAQGDPADALRQLTAARAAEADARAGSLWRPGSLLPAMTLPVAMPVIAGAHLARLRLLVLAAELRGAPWPADALAAGGAPVRRIERDGRLIGAYSVGPDGIDGGGDIASDRCWPLYAALGAPRAADPVPAAAAP